MPDEKPKPAPETEQQKIDESVEETFPASDPPANTGTTGPND